MLEPCSIFRGHFVAESGTCFYFFPVKDYSWMSSYLFLKGGWQTQPQMGDLTRNEDVQRHCHWVTFWNQTCCGWLRNPAPPLLDGRKPINHGMFTMWRFPESHEGTPSHHPFLDGIFPELNHPAMGYNHPFWGTPINHLWNPPCINW